MTHFCAFCEQEIKDRDDVTVVVRAPYKKTNSKIVWGISKNDIEPLADTLAHFECRSPYYET